MRSSRTSALSAGTDHAAAGADVDGLPLQHIGLADNRFYGFHPLRTPFCVHFAVDDKGELVAADAEGVVRVPHTAPQPARHRFEQLVADVMAVSIIHRLEPVKVEVEQLSLIHI